MTTDVAESTAGAIVETRINDLMVFGNEAVDNVRVLQNSLTTLLQELSPPDVSSLREVIIPSPAPINYSRPRMGEVDFMEPQENDLQAPVYEEIPDVDTTGIRDAMVGIDALSVDYTPPETPALSYSNSTMPQQPTLGNVTTPDVPDFDYPDSLSFDPMVYPTAPVLDQAVFDATKPSLTLDGKLPAQFSFSEAGYVSDVWTTLLDRIKNDVETGGVGVSAEVRDGLYQEMVDKQRDEHERQYREAQARYGASGFSLPTGALISALSEISMEHERQREGFRRQIYLDQMTLAQQNTQWALDKGVQIEQLLRDFFNQSENRRLEVSKAIAQRATEIFNAYVTKLNAETELYKAEGQIYESKLRGESEKVNAYKIEMEGKRIEADIQKTQADIYSSQMAAIEIRARIFSTQNESAKIQTEIESLKLQQYKVSLDAFIAGLEYDKNVVALYAAGIDAEKIKVDIFAQKTSAQSQKIAAWKTVIDAHIAKAELKLRQNAQKIDEYKAELSTYEAELQFVGAYNAAKSEMFKEESVSFTAELDAVKSENMTKIEEMKVRLEEASLNVQKLTEELKLIVQGYVSVNELKLKGSESVMNVSSQLAASALAAANVSASYGQSTSSNYSHNDPVNRAISESHSYTY